MKPIFSVFIFLTTLAFFSSSCNQDEEVVPVDAPAEELKTIEIVDETELNVLNSFLQEFYIINPSDEEINSYLAGQIIEGSNCSSWQVRGFRSCECTWYSPTPFHFRKYERTCNEGADEFKQHTPWNCAFQCFD